MNRVIDTYVLMVMIAVAVAWFVSLISLRHKGIRLYNAIVILLLVSIAFVFGAKALHYLGNAEAYDIGAYSWNPGNLKGFALYGGIMFAVIVSLAVGSIMKIDFWQIIDSLVLAFIPAVILVRFGCLTNGCCFGKPTDLPWGITYPFDSGVYLFGLHKYGFVFPHAIHPTQVYEMIFVAIALIAGICLSRNSSKAGKFALVFTVVFTLGRWINYYLRENLSQNEFYHDIYPFLYAIIIIACLYMLKHEKLKEIIKRKRSG